MASRKKILIVGASSLVGNDLFKNFKKKLWYYWHLPHKPKSIYKRKNFYKIDLKSKEPFKNLKIIFFIL